MSRWKAALIHLGLSAVIALGVLVLILGIWYPAPYFQVSRADTLIILIIGVDLILGPLLTLLVFDTRKRWLKFDLAVIATLQLAALAYGVHALYVSRPVFLVAEKDRVTMVYANEVQFDAADDSPYRELPKWGPELVSLKLPDDAESISQAIELMMGGGTELRRRLAAYAPIDRIEADMAQQGQPATDLVGPLPDTGLSAEQMRYVPVYCRSGTVYLLLDASTGKALAPTDATPGEPGP